MTIYDEFQAAWPAGGTVTFEEFQAAWARTLDRALSEDLRAGQHAMNTLWYARPDLYRYVTQWFGVDCFYRDDCLPRFWTEVAAKW